MLKTTSFPDPGPDAPLVNLIFAMGSLAFGIAGAVTLLIVRSSSGEVHPAAIYASFMAFIVAWALGRPARRFFPRRKPSRYLALSGEILGILGFLLCSPFVVLGAFFSLFWPA